MTIMISIFASACNNKSNLQDNENNKGNESPTSYGNTTLFQRDECSYEAALSSEVKPMTADELQSLDNCTITYNASGNISFINGQYTDYKVSNVQEAYNSLITLEELLSISLEEIVPVKMFTEENVGTYYTFAKPNNDNYVNGWVLHLIVDSKNTIQGLGISYGDSELGHNSCTDNAPDYTSLVYFENMTASEAKVTDSNGKEITIPVIYNENADVYYLGDLERKILVSVYDEEVGVGNRNTNPYYESKDNTWDDPYAVTLLDNFIKVYDFFANELGICSSDGSGIPIVLYVHTPYNASYNGVHNDLAGFCFSDYTIESLGIVAHEFTHSIFECNCIGGVYANETGSIHEAYAQIFRYLCLSYLQSDDTIQWFDDIEAKSWENTFIDYDYTNLLPPAAIPNQLLNDYGGVHINGQILLNLAIGMNENQGMTKEDLLKLWGTTLSFIISDESYDTLKQQLLLSARLHNQKKWEQAVNAEFERLGFPEEINRNSWLTTTRAGYGRVTFIYDYDPTSEDVIFQFYGENDNIVSNIYKDTTGTLTALVPVGTYDVRLVSFNFLTEGYGGSKEAFTVEVKDGEDITIEEIPEECLPVSFSSMKDN